MLHVQLFCDHFQALIYILQNQGAETKVYFNACPQLGFTHCTIVPEESQNVAKHVKGKAIPLHAWIGPEGSRRLRLPEFKIVGT
jgi:3'-phosphoadenosine 5'-phosphosulfate sulfotransferase (PAPS reductase)/FAD synthetase